MIASMHAGGLGRTARFKGPTYDKVVLLGHASNIIGSAVLPDSSRNRFTHTGSSCTVSSTQTKLGPTSMRCPATGPISYTDNAVFTLGTSDWWFGTFVRFDSTGTRMFFVGQSDSGGSNTAISFQMQKTSGDKLRGFCCSGASVIGDVTGTTNLAANTWYWATYGRQGSNFKLYLNAASEGSASSASSINDSSNVLSLGRLGDLSSDPLSGYMDEWIFEVGQYRGDMAVPLIQFPDW